MSEAPATEVLSQPLWPDTPPHALGTGQHDIPALDVYLPARPSGAAMLILPGGAYTFLSDKSGEQYGRWLAEAGICGIVVRFRLGSHGYRHEALLADAWQAMRVARANADRWQLDTDRIGVIGTSAGGHLASMMVTGVGAADQARPALGAFCYPVISLRDPLAHQETRRNFLGADAMDTELQTAFSGDTRVDGDTPPCFLWHTRTDEEVGAENSVVFARALEANGVPYELHIYERGPHALGLAVAEGLHWSADCVRWLRGHGF